MFKIFHVIKFRVKNFRNQLPLTVYIIVMRLFFVCLIFVARTDYENKSTTKISRFTVHGVDALDPCRSRFCTDTHAHTHTHTHTQSNCVKYCI